MTLEEQYQKLMEDYKKLGSRHCDLAMDFYSLKRESDKLRIRMNRMDKWFYENSGNLGFDGIEEWKKQFSE